MIVPRPPKHPVGLLATWELGQYRARLEDALTRAPEGSAERQLITTRLAGVTAEQDERAHVFDIPGKWAGAL
ncbi:MAG TPA: hypothetical protein VGG16_27845 [Streptosporangiaceae bacterium]